MSMLKSLVAVLSGVGVLSCKKFACRRLDCKVTWGVKRAKLKEGGTAVAQQGGGMRHLLFL